MVTPSIHRLGDAGLLAFTGHTLTSENNDRAHSLAARLKEGAHRGVLDVVPAYTSVLVIFDPRVLAEEDLRVLVRSASAGSTSFARPTVRAHTIPVCYGGHDGPDLAAVAVAHGLSQRDVIAQHSAPTYRVYFVGFMPGWAYMGTVPDAIATPRLSSPRVRVPVGSVGIADAKTGVYPLSTPGGWNLVGRTAQVLWDPGSANPALLAAGDSVRFRSSRSQPETVPLVIGVANPQTPAFEVLEAKGMTTVQDLGRPGYGSVGLACGGVMDREAAVRANRVLGNQDGAAVLELTFTGPELLALRTVCISLAGADMGCEVDGVRVPTGLTWLVRQGSRVRFQGAPGTQRGFRAWLAVLGGFEVPEVLGSRSTYLAAAFGGYAGRPLRAGDALGIGEVPVPAAQAAGRLSPQSGQLSGAEPVTLRFVRYTGPYGATATSVEVFKSHAWRASDQANRTGTRLTTEGVSPLRGAAREVLSFGVVRGTIQLPPSGEPIVLNADHQTTGGYPVIGVVAEADWPALAQVAPGTAVRFVEVTIDEARSG